VPVHLKGKSLIASLVVFGLLGVFALFFYFYARANDESVQLTGDMVVGRWTGPDGGTLVILSDGSFRAGDLPNRIFGFDQKSARVSSVGHWTLSSSIRDPGGPTTEISLIFDRLDGTNSSYAMSVYSAKRSNILFLYFTIGDPDLGRSYEMSR
jgi:hypothetical protein